MALEGLSVKLVHQHARLLVTIYLSIATVSLLGSL